MDIGFYILYLITPILMSIIYWRAKARNNEKTILKYNLFKGVAYAYLVIAIVASGIFSGDTGRYVTGLTLFIAVIEGNNAFYAAISEYRNNYREK